MIAESNNQELLDNNFLDISKEDLERNKFKDVQEPHQQLDFSEPSPLSVSRQQAMLWNNAVQYQIRQGHYLAAQATLTTQLDMGEMDVQGWLNLCEARLHLRNYTNAFYALNKVASSPGNGVTSELLWRTILGWHDLHLFNAIVDSLVISPAMDVATGHRINPSCISYWLVTGVVLFSEDHYLDALYHFDTLIQLDGNNPLGWIGLYKTYKELDAMPQALSVLSQYAKIRQEYRTSKGKEEK